MHLELRDLIDKAINNAEKILSASQGIDGLDFSLNELDNFIRLVNVIKKQASLNPLNLELYKTHLQEIQALYDRITLYLQQQRQLLSKELKIHHQNQGAIKSYTGEI